MSTRRPKKPLDCAGRLAAGWGADSGAGAGAGWGAGVAAGAAAAAGLRVAAGRLVPPVLRAAGLAAAVPLAVEVFAALFAPVDLPADVAFVVEVLAPDAVLAVAARVVFGAAALVAVDFVAALFVAGFFAVVVLAVEDLLAAGLAAALPPDFAVPLFGAAALRAPVAGFAASAADVLVDFDGLLAMFSPPPGLYLRTLRRRAARAGDSAA